jgi:hypothetical protein
MNVLRVEGYRAPDQLLAQQYLATVEDHGLWIA